MTILIVAIGSRGDIQPYIALGKGLRSAGHAVRILTNGEFGELVAAHGIECLTLDLGIQGDLQSRKAREAIEGCSVLASFRELSRLARLMSLSPESRDWRAFFSALARVPVISLFMRR